MTSVHDERSSADQDPPYAVTGRIKASHLGVTTRKCANCPVREAAAMLARSAIRAETQFSRCPKAAKPTVFRKALFRDRNQTIKRTLFTFERRPDAPPRCLPLAQSTRIHAQRLKLSKFGSLEPDNSDTFVSSPPKAVDRWQLAFGEGDRVAIAPIQTLTG